MRGKRRKRAGRRQALLVLDLISEFEFHDWRRTLAVARRIAPRISRLKARANAAQVPVIYVNDTDGKGESDQNGFVE